MPEDAERQKYVPDKTVAEKKITAWIERHRKETVLETTNQNEKEKITTRKITFNSFN